MASALYPKFKEQIQQAGINMSTADIRAMFIDTDDYTYDSTDEFIADIIAAARGPASDAGLTGKTFTNGVFDADNSLCSSASGDVSEAVVVYVHTGNVATDRLIAFIDGISVTFNGGDVTIVWDASGIYAL